MSYCSHCSLYFPREYSLQRHLRVMHQKNIETRACAEQDADAAGEFLKNSDCLQRLQMCSYTSNPVNYAHAGDGSGRDLSSFELEENLTDFMLYLDAVLCEYLYQDNGLGDWEWPELQRSIHLYDPSDLQFFYWGIRTYLLPDQDGHFYEDFETEFTEYVTNETNDWVDYYTQVLYSEVNTLFWSWQIMRSQWVVLEFQRVFGAGLEHVVETIVFHLMCPIGIVEGKHGDAIFHSCKAMVGDCSVGRNSTWLTIMNLKIW